MAVATYGLETICKLLDLTPQRVNQLVRSGVIPKQERGRYELVPVVKAYIRYLRDRAVNNDVGPDSLSNERARMTKARADMFEMERDQMRETLIPSADIEAAWQKVVMNMRAKLIAIPGKAAANVYAAESLAETKAILKDEIYEALGELSRVEVRVDNPVRSSESEEDHEVSAEEVSPTTGDNRKRVGRPRKEAEPRVVG